MPFGSICPLFGIYVTSVAVTLADPAVIDWSPAGIDT